MTFMEKFYIYLFTFMFLNGIILLSGRRGFMGYVFISYSSKNQEEANSIKYLLNSNKIKTWMAPNDIPVGSKYASVIGGAIKGCSCLLLLLTDVSQNSVWVAKEVERAINYKKTIIPVQLEEVILNDEFEMYISTDQILPIKKIDEKAPDIQTLIAAVKTYAGVEEGLDLAQNQEVTVKKSDDDGEIFYTGEIKLPRRLKIGDVIGDKYKVLSGIKEYRNFALYLVVNESANKQWAMEFMNKSIINEKEYAERYAKKMDGLKEFNHPGVPSYVDAVDTPEYFAVIRDYIEGESLSNLLKESVIFPEDHAIEMMLELVDIAKYLDSIPRYTGIALSAENVMVKPDGTIKLMDVSGCLNRPLTIDEIEKCANKIFAIGQIIYYAITGLDPRNDINKIRPIRKINPDFSKGFEYIISKCTAADFTKRYATFDELSADLENLCMPQKKQKRSPLSIKLRSFFKN